MRRTLICGVVVVSCACQPADDQLGPDESPLAAFRTPAIGLEGSATPFDASASSHARTFAWNFGDGTTLNVVDPHAEHVYRDNGTYEATLIVSDSRGIADTASKTITIANVEPQITLLSVPDTVLGGLPFDIEVQFHDPGLDDSVEATLWLGHGNGAGGGPVQPGKYVTTLYDRGTYSLSVWALDKDGASAGRSKDFVVK